MKKRLPALDRLDSSIHSTSAHIPYLSQKLSISWAIHYVDQPTSHSLHPPPNRSVHLPPGFQNTGAAKRPDWKYRFPAHTAPGSWSIWPESHPMKTSYGPTCSFILHLLAAGRNHYTAYDHQHADPSGNRYALLKYQHGSKQDQRKRECLNGICEADRHPAQNIEP